MLLSKIFYPLISLFFNYSGVTVQIERSDWILWAAGDPLVDSQLAKIDPGTFYQYVMGNSFFEQITGWKEIAKATIFLHAHENKMGAQKVVWTRVFTKLVTTNFKMVGVKRLKCLQSLIYWLLRNTGSGTPIDPHYQQRIIAFILTNKKTVLAMLRKFNQNGLASYLRRINSAADALPLNWPKVISFLVRKRQLFNCERTTFA